MENRRIRVIIAGGRKFNDYQLLKSTCDELFKNKSKIAIVSGKCSGADSLGERYARENEILILDFPANWDDVEGKPAHQIGYRNGKPYWKLAGIVRNEEMAKHADALLAFWNGTSSGTSNMIEQAKKYGLKIKIINY